MTFILSIPIEVRLAVLFILGCCAGAVVNLGIYRLAWRQRPIGPWIRPDAKAPPRQLWDRVPVIGWLGLRREANVHGAGFWIRPMLLELLAGIGFALLYWWEIAGYGLVPPFPEVFVPVGVFDPAKIKLALAAIRHEQFICHVVLFCFMLVAFWVDVDEMTVPDGVTIPCTLAGLVLVTLWPYALLPDIIPRQPPAFNILTSVWLTSPLNSHPWLAQGLTGRPALAAAIVAFCGWCLALAAGGWDRRLGCLQAVRYYAVRIVPPVDDLRSAGPGGCGFAGDRQGLVDGRPRLGRPGERVGGRRYWRGNGLARPHLCQCRLAPRGDGFRRRYAAGHDRRLPRLAGDGHHLLSGSLCGSDYRLGPIDFPWQNTDSLWTLSLLGGRSHGAGVVAHPRAGLEHLVGLLPPLFLSRLVVVGSPDCLHAPAGFASSTSSVGDVKATTQ